MDKLRKGLKYLINPDYRFIINANKGKYNDMPDEEYLKRKFKAIMGYELDLDNPKTFNEKIQWLKLHDRKPIYTSMVDKYEAKKYVANIVGEEYIIPTLGVWDAFCDIDFKILPDQFVLKCTHDSGGLVICRDKNSLDYKFVKNKIENSLKKNYYWTVREWPYKNVKPRIIAEKYMEDEHFLLPQDRVSSLVDYKFFCMNGEVKILYISKGLEDHATASISFYDLQGKELYFHRKDFKQYHNAEMPENFDDMISIAEKLGKAIDAPFSRVDLYSIKGNVYFSEITFSPCGGMIPFEPSDADVLLGTYLSLENN